MLDPSAPDHQQLMEDLIAQGDSGRQFEILVLDPTGDSLQQIGDALAAGTGWDALHLVSHGSDGAVQLGADRLDYDTLLASAGEIRAWGEHLDAGADLLIYGCDVASSEAGHSLVDALSRLTGADVAASDDATGHASLGGDWELEASTGAIETEAAFGESLQQGWTSTLGTAVVTTTADVDDGNTSSIDSLNANPGADGAISLREAILAANNTAGIDTITFSIDGGGPHVIAPDSALPVITSALVIDGTTEPDFTANGDRPIVVLAGRNCKAQYRNI